MILFLNEVLKVTKGSMGENWQPFNYYNLNIDSDFQIILTSFFYIKVIVHILEETKF